MPVITVKRFGNFRKQFVFFSNQKILWDSIKYIFRQGSTGHWPTFGIFGTKF